MGKQWKQWQNLFWGAPKSLQMVTAAMKLKDSCSVEEKLWPTWTAYLKSRDITLSTKVRLVQATVFPVVMYGCESWTVKKTECQIIDAFIYLFIRIDAFKLWCWRRLLKSPLDCKVIEPVHPNGDRSWVFIGRTDIEAETPILWPPDAKNWLIWKDPDTRKDWRQEKGMTEGGIVRWHHWLNGHESEQAPEVGDGQGSLGCPWGRKESDMTEQLRWTVMADVEHRSGCPALNME